MARVATARKRTKKTGFRPLLKVASLSRSETILEPALNNPPKGTMVEGIVH